MKYLDIDEKIAFDEENGEILFENAEGSPTVFEIPEDQIWELFRILLKNEGKPCRLTDISREMVIDDPKGVIKGLVSRLRKALNAKGIPCTRFKEEDSEKIRIIGPLEKGGRSGSYSLILPRTANKTEKTLTDLYWNRYENLYAQKDGENKNDEIIARIGDVYQLPLMLDGDRNCRWNINSTDKYCNNILIEAPNGYGKTTFMRSILLSATYEYRNDITPEEKHSYEVIRNYHGVDDSYLCVYIECKNINFDKPADAIDAGWIYENLSGIESIRIDKYVEKRDFEDLIRSYNLNRKLVLLIDGLDEIGADNRSKLIRLLSEFQQDTDCGSHSKVIMTSRPLFWKADFGEYKKYSISNRNIIEDKSVFLEYVKCYSKNYRPEDAERIYEYVTGNTYLRSIATTPAVIVWMIREFRRNGVFYESMERIIEQIMLRYKSRELTVYKEQYKRVYEELAHEYLRLQEGEEGLAYLEAEMLSLIKGCIETIKTEGNRRFNRVFEENKDDEELGELFLTNVALLEFDHGHVRFSNPVFACHLAARRILRSFREGHRFRTDEQLDVLPYRNRYHVMVIASSLALHLSDNRFFEDFGTNASDIRFDLEEAFYEYMRDRWDADGCDEEEKACIQEAAAHLLLCSYGDNVYTNSNMRNKDHILRLESILKTELKECPEAVLKYRSEKG